jgi:hypothetical protein
MDARLAAYSEHDLLDQTRSSEKPFARLEGLALFLVVIPVRVSAVTIAVVGIDIRSALIAVWRSIDAPGALPGRGFAAGSTRRQAG